MTTQQAAQTLELTIPFSKDELNKAYREALLIWHPDRFETNTGLRAKAELKTHQVNEAYIVLSGEAETSSQYAGSTEDNRRYQPPSQQVSTNRDTQQKQAPRTAHNTNVSYSRPPDPHHTTSMGKTFSGSKLVKMLLLPFQFFTPVSVMALFVANKVFDCPVKDLMFLRKGIWGGVIICVIVMQFGGTYQRLNSPTKEYLFNWGALIFTFICCGFLSIFFRSTH
jgi:hypothetical protein